MKKKISLIVLLLILSYIPNVYAATCPLGKEVTTDLANILKIIQILGPILVVVVSIIEVVKTTSKGDIQKESKKLGQRLLKRIIYCILLFFVPVLVQVGAKIAQIDVSSCDLSNPSDNNYTVATTSHKTLSTTTTTKKNSNGGSSGSTDGKFYYTETEGLNPNYDGHTVSLSADQRLKVARALMGERDDADLGTYIGLCQYIRDYIDYGNVTTRSYDSLGSSWLLSASSSRTAYDYSWFESNRPYITQAIEYVFDNGNSAFQGNVVFYVDGADTGNNNSSNAEFDAEIQSWLNNPNLASDHKPYESEHYTLYGEYAGGNRTAWLIDKQGCQTRSNTKVNNGTKNSWAQTS